jgi:hypothetical protein
MDVFKLRDSVVNDYWDYVESFVRQGGSTQTCVWGRCLSSIWDPNSMGRPVHCWDEETPQGDYPVGSPFGDGKAAWQKSMLSTELPDTPRSFTALP